MNTIRKPQSYQEWLLTANKEDVLGAKMLLTFHLLKQIKRDGVQKAFEVAKDSFERALFDKGYIPKTIEFNFQDDIELRAKELTTIIDAQQGASLQDFAGVAYADAVNFYNQVGIWERKSLWQYIKWWLERTFNGIIRNQV